MPRQIPQAKVLANGKMTGVGLAQKNTAKMTKGSKERLQAYTGSRKQLKTVPTTALQKQRKYLQPTAPSNRQNLRSDDAATASSQSSLSSQFDDTDTEDAEEVMTRPHMPTSLDDLSYEPVSNKRVN